MKAWGSPWHLRKSSWGAFEGSGRHVEVSWSGLGASWRELEGSYRSLGGGWRAPGGLMEAA